MSFDIKKFESKLPSFFGPVLNELLGMNFAPTLVGGIVRDYFLTGELGKDWDIELFHPSFIFDRGRWKDLSKALCKFGKTIFLPYEIIRLQVDSYQLEFSPPRIEHFKESQNNHSNFDAEFIFNLPFEKSVLRRDFTINAMGIRFFDSHQVEFLDPLEGVRHLSEKVLHFAGPDFAKDPVRFLRAHRFANRFKFSFSKELKVILDGMSLEGITPAYLWSEMQKASDPINFISFLVQEKNKDLKLPLDKSFSLKLPLVKKIIINPKKHELWIIALEWVDIPSDDWAKYFSVSADAAKRLSRWARSSKTFQNILPEVFHGEFGEIRQIEEFELLFDWYFTTKHLLQKFPDLPLMKMIEEFLPEWIHLYKFEPLRDVRHIDPPFRAKYQVWNLCQRL